MKKILALVVSVVMLLSVGAIYASAADFTPAGDIEITWYENAYNEIEMDRSGCYPCRGLWSDRYVCF